MDDLISRSAYREKLKVAFRTLTRELDKAIRNEDEELILAIRNQQSAYHIAIQILDAQPIAYSVDAVVAELEKYKNWYETHGCNEDLKRGIIGATNHAVDLVRKGGVE